MVGERGKCSIFRSTWPKEMVFRKQRVKERGRMGGLEEVDMNVNQWLKTSNKRRRDAD